MRVLIFGANGMLGHKVVQVLGQRFDVWGTIRDEFAGVERFGIYARERIIEGVDVTDVQAVRHAVETAMPDVVINAAGVVKQVPESNNFVRTLKINSLFPQLLADLSDEFSFRLITISTDCVFSGDKGNYSETDTPDSRSFYGISKLLGEIKHDNCLTIRTSIIGRELATDHSLVEWFLSNRGEDVKGYVDAVYSGFSTIVLAEIIAEIISGHPQLHGVLHVSSDPINKFELIKLLNQNYGAKVNIEPSNERKIDRSLDSSLFRKTLNWTPPSWEQMIEQMAADTTPYDKWKK